MHFTVKTITPKRLLWLKSSVNFSLFILVSLKHHVFNLYILSINLAITLDLSVILYFFMVPMYIFPFIYSSIQYFSLLMFILSWIYSSFINSSVMQETNVTWQRRKRFRKHSKWRWHFRCWHGKPEADHLKECWEEYSQTKTVQLIPEWGKLVLFKELWKRPGWLKWDE
jgi:hypothetical protein